MATNRLYPVILCCSAGGSLVREYPAPGRVHLNMRTKATFLALAVSLLAAGCAGTGGLGDCAKTDWYGQGYADGSRTWVSLIDRHAQNCAASGVKPDAVQYQRGFEQARWDVEHRFK
jgi:hypothetical protein